MDIKVIWRTVKELIERGQIPRVAQIALDAVLAFADKDELNYNMNWYRDGNPSSNDVDNYYPGLISIEHLIKDWHEAEVSFSGLEYFANQYLEHHKDTRVLVMGHTHYYKLVWSGNRSNPIYVNSGFNCAAKPDMINKKRIITFIEVIEDTGQGFTVNEKIVDFETGDVTQGDTVTTSWD
jgi:hypothetical protein